mmetsp:Transcript_4818/g.17246  ORF Transcript_4818/g.17246 Transcript_4818/m.17246 type:complete len:247 (+) Transcript_4818:606-1346(+)
MDALGSIVIGTSTTRFAFTPASVNVVRTSYPQRISAPCVLAGHPGGIGNAIVRSPKYPGANPGCFVVDISKVLFHRSPCALRPIGTTAHVVIPWHGCPTVQFASIFTTATSAPGTYARLSVDIVAFNAPPVMNFLVAVAAAPPPAAGIVDARIIADAPTPLVTPLVTPPPPLLPCCVTRKCFLFAARIFSPGVNDTDGAAGPPPIDPSPPPPFAPLGSSSAAATTAASTSSPPSSTTRAYPPPPPP